MLKAFKRSPYICFPCLPGMDVLLLRSNNLHRSFVQEAWRYPFVILGKNNMHIMKVFGNLKLWDKVWALVIRGHEASNLKRVKHIKPYLLSLPLTWVSPLKIFCILMVTINVLHVYSLLTFNIHFHLEKERKKNSTQCLIVHRAFYFVLNIMIYCWTCVKGNENYHFISHLHIVIHQRLNHVLYALLFFIELNNKLQSPY